MPASVTSHFRIANAKTFIDSFEEPENGGRNTVVGQSYVYLFIGKVLSWDKTHAGYSDAHVPTPDNDIQGNEYEPWRDMIALDRVIANTDISLGAKRHDWISGTVYDLYDDQNPAITKATSENGYYVYETDAGHIFKCLDNNAGATSTTKPTIPSAALLHAPFITSDGYRWKYMATISSGSAKKWLSTNYIPVRTLNAIAQPGGTNTELVGAVPAGFENQAIVQKRANVGTIESYVVVSGGAGFVKHSTGTPLADRTLVTSGAGQVTNGSFFSLKDSSLLTDYKGAAIYIANSTFQKGIGWIKDYGALNRPDGTPQSQTVLLDPEFSPDLAPYADEIVTYEIGPIIEIVGDGPRNTDGTGAANAYATCTSGGGIDKITAWTTGNSYTTATVSVIGSHGETPSGVGLSARGIISPPGGHGSDPVSELGAFNVIISKTLTGAGGDNAVARNGIVTGNNFPIANEYRTIGLLKNPYLKENYDATQLAPATGGKNWYANSSPLHQSTWIVANTTVGSLGSWTPTADDEVKGLTSAATGRIIEYNADKRAIMNITNIVANTSGGTFMPTEKIGRLSDESGSSYDSTQVYVTANGVQHDGNSTIIYEPDLQPFTGEILYLENRPPITRSLEQSEDIKLVIEF